MQKKDDELAQLREAVAKHESVEDIVSRLNSSQAPTETSVQGLGQEETAALFEQLLTNRDVKATQSGNMKTVQDALVATFGDAKAANEAVVAKAAELGTTAKALGDLSKVSPKMVLEYFKDVQSAPTGAPATSSINSDGFQTQQNADGGLKRPKKSLLAGATSREQAAFMKEIQAEVYKKFNVET